MGKTKKSGVVAATELRKSPRLLLLRPTAPGVEKKKVIKRAPAKAKKGKATENGNPKAEEPKVEATEAK